MLQYIKSHKAKMIDIILTSFPYEEYSNTYLSTGANFFYDKTKDFPQMIVMLNKMVIDNGG